MIYITTRYSHGVLVTASALFLPPIVRCYTPLCPVNIRTVLVISRAPKCSSNSQSSGIYETHTFDFGFSRGESGVVNNSNSTLWPEYADLSPKRFRAGWDTLTTQRLRCAPHLALTLATVQPDSRPPTCTGYHDALFWHQGRERSRGWLETNRITKSVLFLLTVRIKDTSAGSVGLGERRYSVTFLFVVRTVMHPTFYIAVRKCALRTNVVTFFRPRPPGLAHAHLL